MVNIQRRNDCKTGLLRWTIKCSLTVRMYINFKLWNWQHSWHIFLLKCDSDLIVIYLLPVVVDAWCADSVSLWYNAPPSVQTGKSDGYYSTDATHSPEILFHLEMFQSFGSFSLAILIGFLYCSIHKHHVLPPWCCVSVTIILGKHSVL